MWSQFKLFQLTEIMRQKDDARFARTLNIIGDVGLAGLSERQVRMLDERIVDQSEIPDDAIYLFFHNEPRIEFNYKKIMSMPGELVINDAFDEAQGQSSRCDPALRSLSCLNRARVASFREAQQRYQNTQADDDYDHHGKSKKKANKGKKDTKIGLSNTLMLKVGCRYMIMENEDQAEGFVNGAVGKIMKIVCIEREVLKADNEGNYRSWSNTTRKRFADRLWMLFDNDDVGKIGRAKNAAMYDQDEIVIEDRKHWVLVRPAKFKISEANRLKYHIERTQFNLVESEAITIHKSQGDTFSKVAFDVAQGGLTRSAVYVALSRCTKLSGLYLYSSGPDQHPSIMPLRYRKKTAEQRALLVEEERQRHRPNQVVSKMLLERPVINRWPFLEDDYRPAKINLMYQNIASFKKHNAKLAADFGFRRADVIMFVETRSNPKKFADSNAFTPTHTVVYVSGSEYLNASNGQVVLVRNDLTSRMKLIANNCDTQTPYNLYQSDDLTNICELSLFRYEMTEKSQKPYSDYLYICLVYKHPKMQFKEFYNQLKVFLTRHMQPNRKSSDQFDFCQKKFIIIGDFNMDYVEYLNMKENKTKTSSNIFDLKFKLNMKMALNKRESLATTQAQTCIDWCLESKHKSLQRSRECHIYESYFGYHKPIWYSINQDPEVC